MHIRLKKVFKMKTPYQTGRGPSSDAGFVTAYGDASVGEGPGGHLVELRQLSVDLDQRLVERALVLVLPDQARDDSAEHVQEAGEVEAGDPVSDPLHLGRGLGQGERLGSTVFFAGVRSEDEAELRDLPTHDLMRLIVICGDVVRELQNEAQFAHILADLVQFLSHVCS